jgi:hypothetical protein
MAEAGARRLQWLVDLDLGGSLDVTDYDSLLTTLRRAGT